MIERNFQLDYLRGLMATLIMLYHYYSWIIYPIASESILGKVGIYGVSVFYILSGLTLYMVYSKGFSLSKHWLRNFFVKRFFRIYPLLILTITLYIFADKVVKQPTIWDLFLNYTGLFGVIDPSNCIAAGQWSIGNELVFYLCFPFLIFTLKKRRMAFFISFTFLVAIAGYISVFSLDINNNTLANQWSIYVNPLNHIYFFIVGILIGFTDKYFIHIPIYIFNLILIFATLLFIIIPSYGDNINIVTGGNRLVFSFISIIITFCFFHQKEKFPYFLHIVLKHFGDISYSMYLLHPIFYGIAMYVSKSWLGLDLIPMMILTIISSIIGSSIIYQYLEKPLVSFGRIFLSS